MRVARMLPPLLVGGFLYWLSPPVFISTQAWRLFSLFAGTIVALISRPYPTGVVAIIAMTLAITLGILDMQTHALRGFGSPTIWMVGSVFFMARGVIRSQLGERLAYYFIYRFGKTSLGLGYAIALTECLFASVVPSSTARSGGIIMPIVSSINTALDSHPHDESAEKIGVYLVQCAYHTNIISSALFLTGMVSNPLCQSIAQAQGVFFSWTDWFYISFVPGALSLLLAPWLLLKLTRPTMQALPHAKALAQEKLQSLGPLSCLERRMLLVFAVLLFFWIDPIGLHVNATAVAFMGLCLTFLLGIVTLEDMLAEKNAWHTILWLSILVTFCSQLEAFGFVSAVTRLVGEHLSYFSTMGTFFSLTLLYFLLGYMFAGNATHVSALYGAFLSLLVSKGAPPILSAIVLANLSSLYSSLTHYGSTTGSIYFALEYLTLGRWWKIGAIIASTNLVIWFGIGYWWWSWMGFW